MKPVRRTGRNSDANALLALRSWPQRAPAAVEVARLVLIKTSRTIRLTLIALTVIALSGCDDMVPRDTASLLLPEFKKSEILGFVAGLGTTCAGLPDLLAMFRRRSTAGMNPRMAGILGTFQILWIHYGLLIASRPVILWNIIAVIINFLSVAAYRHYARLERQRAMEA